MKILYVTRSLNQKSSDGGLVVSKRNLRVLSDLYGSENIDLFEIEKCSIYTKLINILCNSSYGISKKEKVLFKKQIAAVEYDCVFLNSSLFDFFAKYCAKKNIPIITFFHNIEFKYYEDMMEDKNIFLKKIFCHYIKNHERNTIQYTQYIFVLNDRDSNLLKEIYSRDADLQLPISCKKHEVLTKLEKRNNCGFIGSNFFANQDGVSWFIENILPYINRKIVIAGSITDYIKEKYRNNDKIEYMGYVEKLDDFYDSVDFIVSPIFLGSGMKTKTIEALSYGKSIIGTTEAFVGLKVVYDKVGGLCNTKEEFIRMINKFNLSIYNEYSYDCFENFYSDECILFTLRRFMESRF